MPSRRVWGGGHTSGKSLQRRRNNTCHRNQRRNGDNVPSDTNRLVRDGGDPIEATYLPWNTELTDPPVENASHEVHYEPRVRSYGTVQPAWTVKCGFMGSTAVDTCAGEPAGEVKNTASGVAVKFESKSPALACTGSAIGTGTVEGTLSLTSATEGKTLSVYGAPGP